MWRVLNTKQKRENVMDKSIMRQWRTVNLDALVNSYIDCALWSSSNTGDEGNDLGDFLNYGLSDRFKQKMRERVARTLAKRSTRALLKAYIDAHIAHHDNPLATVIYNDFGHDLWLTENGHGVGFWDREYLNVFPECTNGETLGDALTEVVQYREAYLYLDDNNCVCID